MIRPSIRQLRRSHRHTDRLLDGLRRPSRDNRAWSQSAVTATQAYYQSGIRQMTGTVVVAFSRPRTGSYHGGNKPSAQGNGVDLDIWRATVDTFRTFLAGDTSGTPWLDPPNLFYTNEFSPRTGT